MDYSGLNSIYEIIDNVLQNQAVHKCINRLRRYSSDLYKHSSNVALLSILMSKGLYDCAYKYEELFIAALLHDYGKIYTVKSILEKPSLLTVEERKIMEKHSFIDYIYLKNETDLSEEILNSVLDHHERLDGSGYGLMKTSDEITDYAKVIMIADVYDAMASDRVYRKRISSKLVMEYLLSNAGIKFEEYLIKLLIKVTTNYDMDVMKMEFIKRLTKMINTSKSFIEPKTREGKYVKRYHNT